MKVAALILFAALAIRVAFVLATPGYTLVHDAVNYDEHARSIAAGDGYATAFGRPTAFRPPAYPFFLAGVYAVTGPDVEAGRLANAVVGTGIVALIGLIAFQLWGRREAWVAMALAAVYVPLITVGQAVMSEPLFALFMLGSIAAVLRAGGYRWVVLAGVLAGLAILARANAVILLLPLAFAVWRGPKPALVLLAAAVLTVAPWTMRNAIALDAFVPVSTQFGSALAGTYNSEARDDRENPASWRALHHLEEYGWIERRLDRPEAEIEKDLRRVSLEFIREHPGYVGTVAFWTTRRMLDLGGLDWSIHTASTISVGKRWAIAGVVCFWVYALLAVAGAFTRRARAAPLWLWAFPVLMWLSVVFLVVETPRYRTAIDPFVILLAALALTIAGRDRRPDSGAESLGGVPRRDPVAAGGAAAGG